MLPSRLPVKNLILDLSIIFLSIIVAIILVRTHALEGILATTKNFAFLSSFIAGIFFTNVFTTAPAMVALGEISASSSAASVALFGALGAVCGDFLIFRFIKNTFADDVLYVVQHAGHGRLFSLFRTRIFRSLIPFIGGLIIASPLPDELGLALFSVADIKPSTFLPISFSFNFIGILVIGLIAQSLRPVL